MHITLRYAIALLLLCIVVQEAHEIAHMLTDHLLQGCGGTRYFLYWQLCETGDAKKVAITALAGPFVNFILLFYGYVLLGKTKSRQQKSRGITIIMATLPLQRLQAFVFRGSDEITAFKKLMSPAEPFKGAALIAGLLLILLFLVPALYRAFKNLEGKNQWLNMLALLVVPFIVALACQHFGAIASVRTFLLSPTHVLWTPSWLGILDVLLLLLYLMVAKNIDRLFSS